MTARISTPPSAAEIPARLAGPPCLLCGRPLATPAAKANPLAVGPWAWRLCFSPEGSRCRIHQGGREHERSEIVRVLRDHGLTALAAQISRRGKVA